MHGRDDAAGVVLPSGSLSLLLTLLVTVKLGPEVAEKDSDAPADPPTAIVPRLQVTTVVEVQPFGFVRMAFAGMGTVTVTPVAVKGPLLATINM